MTTCRSWSSGTLRTLPHAGVPYTTAGSMELAASACIEAQMGGNPQSLSSAFARCAMLFLLALGLSAVFAPATAATMAAHHDRPASGCCDMAAAPCDAVDAACPAAACRQHGMPRHEGQSADERPAIGNLAWVPLESNTTPWAASSALSPPFAGPPAYLRFHRFLL